MTRLSLRVTLSILFDSINSTTSPPHLFNCLMFCGLLKDTLGLGQNQLIYRLLVINLSMFHVRVASLDDFNNRFYTSMVFQWSQWSYAQWSQWRYALPLFFLRSTLMILMRIISEKACHFPFCLVYRLLMRIFQLQNDGLN